MGCRWIGGGGEAEGAFGGGGEAEGAVGGGGECGSDGVIGGKGCRWIGGGEAEGAVGGGGECGGNGGGGDFVAGGGDIGTGFEEVLQLNLLQSTFRDKNLWHCTADL